MLTSAKVVGFVPAKNLAQAKVFYSDTLGFRVLDEDHFGLSLDANGTRVRIANVGEHQPAAFTILGWEVSDIREAVADLARRGVRFEKFDRLEQDELGIWKAPSGARVAWFKDPEGNVLSLSQHPGST